MIDKPHFIYKGLNLLESTHLLKKKKKLTDEVSLIFDDSKYKRYFERQLGQKIYEMHIDEHFMCCAFCESLQKSSCHEHCFTCSKGTYSDCGSLLPGTFSFSDSYFDLLGSSYTPWIFRTPCTSFERINNKRYFRNFNSSNKTITMENYEALEGLFLGICRGRRPCHICASVNLDIYNKCSQDERTAENAACNRIIREISQKYQAILGMIRYVE